MKQEIGIIGYGTVGKALYSQISALPAYSVKGVAVKRSLKDRHLPGLTKNALELVQNPEIDVILEAIDRSEDAFLYASESLKAGKTYITASKKMVAENLAKLVRLERNFGGRLLFEAAVGGAIPVLRTIREHLSGEPILGIRGIVNGSCNYILTRMAEGELEFEEALDEAIALGYAESDPSSDIDGFDSYYKSILLAYAAFGDVPEFKRVVVEGIRNVRAVDIKRAKRDGEKIKLVAEIERLEDQFTIDIRPRFINSTDPLYGVDKELNGIQLRGVHTGNLMLQGPGAGGNPTASAMVGDLLNANNGKALKVKQLLLALK